MGFEEVDMNAEMRQGIIKLTIVLRKGFSWFYFHPFPSRSKTGMLTVDTDDTINRSCFNETISTCTNIHTAVTVSLCFESFY